MAAIAALVAAASRDGEGEVEPAPCALSHALHSEPVWKRPFSRARLHFDFDFDLDLDFAFLPALPPAFFTLFPFLPPADAAAAFGT